MSSTVEAEIAELRAHNERIRSQVSRLRTFVDKLQALVTALDQPQSDEQVMAALSDCLKQALETIDAVCASLLALDEDTRELVFVLVQGEVPAAQLAWQRVPAGAGIAGWVARHAEPLIVNEVRTDERFYADIDASLGFSTQSVLAVPIIGRDKVLGVFEVLNKRGTRMFDEDDQTLMVLMSRFAGELLHRMSQKEGG